MADKKRKPRSRWNGDGSVYQRASDGRWVACLPYKDALGNTEYAYRYRHTPAEAKAALQELVRDREAGQLGHSDIETVVQFLESWLDVTVRPNLKQSTYESYERVMRQYAIPVVGKIKIRELSHNQVQVLANKLTSKGLGAGQVRLVHRILHIALNEAVRWGIIQRNPATGVRLPRIPKTKATVLSPEQARAFLQKIEGDRLEAFFAVALGLGLRRGEAAGLRWQDIDFEAREIHIRKSLQKLATGTTLTTPKNESSEAKIYVPAPLLAKLKAHRKRQIEERMLQGDKWKDWQAEGLVFTGVRGNPLTWATIARHLDAVLSKADLPHMTLHELRKSCATLLHAQGVSDMEIQHILRHSSIHVTQSIYIQGVPSLQRAALDELGDLLFGDR